jgi:hypothetical protein
MSKDTIETRLIQSLDKRIAKLSQAFGFLQAQLGAEYSNMCDTLWAECMSEGPIDYEKVCQAKPEEKV